ncbi:MAG: helix-turn-helix domain-containing protein [Bacillaceae bacterium]
MNNTRPVIRCNLKEILESKRVSLTKLASDIRESHLALNDLVSDEDMGNIYVPAQIVTKICVTLEITPNDLLSVEFVED